MGIRLNKVLKQLNVSTETVVEYLKSKPGLEPVKEMNPNTKVTDEQYAALLREFHGDKLIKERADSIFPVTSKEHKPSLRITNGQGGDDKVAGKSDIDATSQSTPDVKALLLTYLYCFIIQLLFPFLFQSIFLHQFDRSQYR